MIVEIPPALSERAFTQETLLDGTTYRLTFRWNVREGAWYLDLLTAEDVLIAGGLKLVGGAFLLRHITGAVRPPGELWVEGIPTETNLGTEAVLLYLDEDELAGT
jgi:hypothetical protein